MTDTADETPDETPDGGTFTAEQMTEVRNEAKTWRLKLREAETERDTLRGQVQELTEARDALTSELDGIKAQQTRAAEIEEIASEYGVPGDVLRGETKEDLVAHAELLKPVYAKANGAFVERIGDSPEKPTNELADFAAELFGSN